MSHVRRERIIKIPREIVRKHREISLIDKKKKEYEIH